MKKLMIIALILVGALFVPAVSAEILINDDLIKSVDTSISGTPGYDEWASSAFANDLVFEDITQFRHLSYISCDANQHLQPALSSGRHDFTYNFNGEARPGVVYKAVYTNALGQITQTRLTIFLNNWDIGTLNGKQIIKLPFMTEKSRVFGLKKGTGIGVYIGTCDLVPAQGVIQGHYTVASASYWKNHLLVENTSDELSGYDIMLTRTIDGELFKSTIELYQDENIVSVNTAYGTEFRDWQPESNINKILISSVYGNFTYHLGSGPDDPDDPDESATLTVYIKNSQTGALIANANVAIDALVNGEYYPVTNRTEPSGIFITTLQPTGGGQPNPDGYRLIVTADGYNNPMPEINFTVDDYKQSIYCLLDPRRSQLAYNRQD